MKRLYLIAIVSVISLYCNAQFKLTPSAGLVTEDGPYTIMRPGTESENYEAVWKAVEKAIPDAEMGELEYEKSFAVNAIYKTRAKLPSALIATDWVLEYDLKVEVAEDKILIFFSNIGTLKATAKLGNNTFLFFPTMGKNTMISPNRYLFNSKGQICKGGKKMVAIFENIANGIVRDIENNL